MAVTHYTPQSVRVDIVGGYFMSDGEAECAGQALHASDCQRRPALVTTAPQVYRSVAGLACLRYWGVELQDEAHRAEVTARLSGPHADIRPFVVVTSEDH